MQVSPEIQGLETEAQRIVGMICSESVAGPVLDAAIEALRARTAELFPEAPGLFDATYGRRFRRLRTWFQPRDGLF